MSPEADSLSAGPVSEAYSPTRRSVPPVAGTTEASARPGLAGIANQERTASKAASVKARPREITARHRYKLRTTRNQERVTASLRSLYDGRLRFSLSVCLTRSSP